MNNEEKMVILGGVKLHGEVKISGAKNSAVAILVASILVKGKCVIENVPHVSDILDLIDIINGLGGVAEFVGEDTVEVDCSDLTDYVASYDSVRKIRASSYLMGALLGRLKKASVALPGGCDFGVRPIDQHIKGFEALGAKVDIEYGMVNITADELVGDTVYLDVVSVGATINIMLAAALADGITVIDSAAKEPHVVDVANFLNSMGANIKGAGTDVIRIKGVDKLHGTTYSIIPDQIEAGTFMVAAAMTSGDVLIKDAIWEHNRPLISKLLEMGVYVKEEDGGIRVKSDVSQLKPVTVKTLPHPGFPTDMQAQFTALMAVVKGESTMIETVFENRFQHLEEMRRMGLHSEILRDTAMIHGGLPLQGAQVMSTDLRASAALILTGMVAEGTTTVGKLTHLDRGYYQFHEKLAKLGANISRVSEG